MSVVPPEFGYIPALSVYNGDNRQGISSPLLQGAFTADLMETHTPVSSLRFGQPLLFLFTAFAIGYLLYHLFPGLSREKSCFFSNGKFYIVIGQSGRRVRLFHYVENPGQDPRKEDPIWVRTL